MSKRIKNRTTIGVLPGWQAYTGTLDSFLAAVFHGIRKAAVEWDCNLMFACGIGAQRSIDLGKPAWPVIVPEVDFVPVGPWNTDGLIVLPPLALDIGTFYFQELIASGFPLVFGGDRAAGPAVVPDNEAGIREAFCHLCEHGHQSIAFIAGHKHRELGDSGMRLRAYLAGVEEMGLEYDPDLIAYGHHTYEGGKEAMKEILSRGGHFSAVLASNDESAIGAIDVLRDNGLAVPQDVAVIGFDDRSEAKANVPLLTTVHHPMVDLGYQCVEYLLKVIRGDIKGNELVRIPTRLVIRETCGCLPGAMMNPGPNVGINLAKNTHAAQRPPRAGSIPGVGYDLETSVRQKPDGDVAVSRTITLTVYKEIQRLSLREVEYLCTSLVEAFKFSLMHGDETAFLSTLQQILEYVSSLGDDLYAWQVAVSLLRESALSLLGPAVPVLTSQQMEDMLHRARVGISEVSRVRASRLAVEQASIADQIGRMTTLFFAARDEAEVFQFLVDGVKSIGIHNVTAAIYEPDGEDLIAWSILQTPHTRYKGDRRFPTRHYPPEGLYPTNRPYILAIAPLHIGDQGRGFIAFDTVNFDMIAMIVRQVEAALKGVHLLREREEARRLADEGRRMAEEANRLKSRFLSIVSHEIRTPLNLIFSLSDMLLRESQPVSSDRCIVDKNDLERIHIGAQHLDSLIRDVLDLARSDVGQLKLTCEPLNLSEVLESASAIGKQLASGKNLEWKVAIPEDLPRVWGDRTRLRQVILNLVNNAVKFTARGEIALSASVEDGYVTVAVADTGLGIPRNEQDVIFEEFRQSKRTTARGFGGLGLGLSICKRLVEMHAGTIGVSSTGKEGEGSRFFFSLPVMTDQGREDREDIALTQVQQVLLLVKDRGSADLLEAHLAEQGYKVKVYQIKQDDDWLVRVLQVAPDVIVIDLGLTAERGWEILSVLKENPAAREIPVLFYTIERGEDKGSLLEVDFLIKPIGTVELANALIAQGLLPQGWNGENNTILVIDDDLVILDLHSRIIQAQFKDYRVITASNGREGLEIIRREKPSLVLLDLIMPELDGFGVLDAMRREEISRDIPVIILTGQVLTSEDMLRLNQGVAGVLGKGLFSVEETLNHISAALARKRKPGSEHQRLVLKAMAYIHANYPESITRSDIARSVGLSERHLTRCFRQELGITPITYLNRYRVRQAKAMLEAGNKRISDISADVGFSTSGYFTRVFRDEVGVSPREYLRNKVRVNKNP